MTIAIPDRNHNDAHNNNGNTVDNDQRPAVIDGDVNLGTGTLHVRRRLAQLSRGGLQAGPPKSAAGVRNIALPDFLVDELRTHMKKHAGPGPEGCCSGASAARCCGAGTSAGRPAGPRRS